jgi:hypothetical protein
MTLLRNRADGIAAIDLFRAELRLLYPVLIMGHGRRQIP